MLKVLVVDDEMLARDELKYLLERTKEVEIIGEADCVEDALEELMKNKPDIVFLDIQLSDDNGFEIANILKKMKIHLQLYLLLHTISMRCKHLK